MESSDLAPALAEPSLSARTGRTAQLRLEPGDAGAGQLMAVLASGDLTRLPAGALRWIAEAEAEAALQRLRAAGGRTVSFQARDRDGGEPIGFEAVLGPETAERPREVLLRQVADPAAPTDLDHRELVENTSEGYWLIDARTLATRDVNDGLCRLLGYAREEMIGRAPFEFTDQAGAETMRANTRRIGTAYHRAFEVALRARDGRMVPVHFNATTVYDAAGRPRWAYAFITDLSRVRRAESALAESERRFRIVFEDAGIGMAMADARGRFLEANPALQRFLGYDAEELRDLDTAVLSHPADLDKDRELFEELKAGRRQSYQVEKRYLRKDGRVVWGRLTATVCPADCSCNGASEPVLVTMIEDIDEHWRFEQELWANQARLEIAQHIARIGSWEMDLNADRLWWSDELYELLGYRPGEVAPTFDLSVQHTHPDDRAVLLEAEQAARQGVGQTTEAEFRVVRRDGEQRFVYLHARTFGDEQDRPVRLVGTLQDLTARRQVEAERDRLAAILAATPDFVAVIEPEGTGRYLNRGGRLMLGYAPSETPEAEGIEPLFAPATRIAWREEIAKVAARDGIWRGEGELQHGDGHAVPVSLVVIAHRQSTGEVESYSVIARDISGRKAMENALREAKERAEQAAQARSQFLANMSHEIRTPMNSILGVADLLAETDLDPTQRGYLDVFRNAGQGLMQVLNDILDLSKVEAGELALEARPFDLPRLLREQRDLFALQAQDKALDLVLEVADAVPRRVVGDENRLRQVVGNLLGNAVKFTDHGAIRVTAEPAPEHGEAAVCFTVADTGQGIGTEKLGEVFQAFMQADGGVGRRHGGTGLGLTIAQRLVDRMGGDLKVESIEGEGSTFWFSLPFGVAPKVSAEPGAAAAGAARPESLSPQRVLLAEDSPDNVMLVQAFLKGAPCTVDVVEDGAAAVEAVRNGGYDLVLMDIQMPGMDGLSATRAIRQWEAEQGAHRTPIVALTAHALEEHQNRAREAGCDGYLTKPVKKERLLATLETFAGG